MEYWKILFVSFREFAARRYNGPVVILRSLATKNPLLHPRVPQSSGYSVTERKQILHFVQDDTRLGAVH
jgi:hypothetical protein